MQSHVACREADTTPPDGHYNPVLMSGNSVDDHSDDDDDADDGGGRGNNISRRRRRLRAFTIVSRMAS